VEFEIRILGPVELQIDGQRSKLLAKERQLLATLAIDVGKAIPLDLLVDRLWDETPPPSARNSLQVYASHIRKALSTTGPGLPCLTHRAHTYTLDAEPDSVDLHRYFRLTSQARSLSESGDDAQALELFHRADEEWRGEPLSGLSGLWPERIRVDLASKRLDAVMPRFPAELRLGRFAEAARELRALVSEHPDDEELLGHLMVALHGRERHAEALQLYDAHQRRLQEALGAVPGPALRHIHQLVVNHAPLTELVPPHPATASRSLGTPAPRNLPRHGTLVGRSAELTLLRDCVCTEAAGPGSVIALQSVTGMGGVGKTLLALHAAETLADRFPDGQICVELHSHTPGQEPLSTHKALFTLLREFGVPAVSIPADVDQATSLWRTLLRNRRAVIILDDVADSDQVRALLPGNSPSLVIITSRRRLPGLPGVRPIVLEPLPTADAIEMFRRSLRDGRAEDTREVADIVRFCGHLPLAIEIAAARLTARSAWSLSRLRERLAPPHGRIGQIRDSDRELASVFEMSYQALTNDQRTVFRLLSLHLGPEFGTHTAAALAGLSLEAIERHLETLLGYHLLREPEAERYTYHDLLGEYARTLATAEDSADDRERAVQRVIDFLLYAADRADRLAHPRRPRLDVHHQGEPRHLPGWRDGQDAKRWLMQEYAALIAAERHSRTHGTPRRAALLAHVLAEFLDTEGHWAEARRAHEHAARYWREQGNPRAQARALVDLGRAHSHMGDYDEAEAAGRQALDLACAEGEFAVEREARQLLWELYWNTSQLTRALAIQEETLAIELRCGDAWQISRSYNNKGITHLYSGDHASASVAFQAALAGFRGTGDMHRVSNVLNNLSDLYIEMGDRDSAYQTIRESLDISKTTGSQSDQAIAKINLAKTLDLPAELHSALDLCRDGLFFFRRLGDRRNESNALNAAGYAFLAARRDNEAAAHHRSALDLARSIGARHEVVQSLRGLGTAELHLGRLHQAEEHLREAQALAGHIGARVEEKRSSEALSETLSRLRRGRSAGGS
jgi:DNA-binding SARP family transcriptional activator